MKNSNLPAGIVDKGVEFFVHNYKVMATYDGKVLSINELPNDILEIIRDYMLTKPEALKALNNQGFNTDSEMLKKFIKCNFGGFNKVPDIDLNKNINAEYWDCGIRGTCVYEGKLCEGLKVANGILTKREIDVLKLIVKGKLDKEIADVLKISIHTVASHKTNIQEKTGLQTKIEFAIMAINKGLI